MVTQKLGEFGSRHWRGWASSFVNTTHLLPWVTCLHLFWLFFFMVLCCLPGSAGAAPPWQSQHLAFPCDRIPGWVVCICGVVMPCFWVIFYHFSIVGWSGCWRFLVGSHGGHVGFWVLWIMVWVIWVAVISLHIMVDFFKECVMVAVWENPDVEHYCFSIQLWCSCLSSQSPLCWIVRVGCKSSFSLFSF